jgi:hypothetical protein
MKIHAITKVTIGNTVSHHLSIQKTKDQQVIMEIPQETFNRLKTEFRGQITDTRIRDVADTGGVSEKHFFCPLDELV